MSRYLIGAAVGAVAALAGAYALLCAAAAAMATQEEAA